MGAACPCLLPVSQPPKSTATPTGSLGQPGPPQPASCLREGAPQKGQPSLHVHQCSLGIQSPRSVPDERVGLCRDPALSGAQVPFTALQFSVTLITIILLPFTGHLLSARPTAKCFSQHHHIQSSGPTLWSRSCHHPHLTGEEMEVSEVTLIPVCNYVILLILCHSSPSPLLD